MSQISGLPGRGIAHAIKRNVGALSVPLAWWGTVTVVTSGPPPTVTVDRNGTGDTIVCRLGGAYQATSPAVGDVVYGFSDREGDSWVADKMAVEARTSQSGSLTSTIAAAAGTTYVPFSIALGIGTWLVTYGASFLAGAANGSLIIWATVGSATATLSGKWNGEVYVPSGDQSDISIAFLVTVTAAGYINLNAEATAAGTIEISNGYVTGGQTGWTAVPVH